MPSLVAVNTVSPLYKFDQNDVRRLAGRLFSAASFDIAQMQGLPIRPSEGVIFVST